MRPCLFTLLFFLLYSPASFSQVDQSTRNALNPNLYMIKFGKKKKPFNIKDSTYVSMVLPNDSVRTIFGKFNMTDGKQSIAGEGKSYTPSDAKELYVAISEEQSITGISKDTCWLFKTTLGYISAYGKTPELDTKNIVAIQKSRGEIMPFSKELLMEWLKGNDKAVKLAEKGKYLEAIKLYNE
jgi:hypothetical protein